MARRLGKYELLERVALGGMAEVYLAKQAGPAGFEKRVVLKCILPQYARDASFIRMFLDEARLAARLSHPNIVQIFELGDEDGTYFIAMEYIQGISLGDLIDDCAALGAPIPFHFGARIIADVCAGLDYAHDFRDDQGNLLGLVHRDMSPDNVLISANGAVKMIDFGVAKAVTNETKTDSGVVKGKFCYMSPEQIMGQDLDGRSDLFSVGILLYETATGVRPFGDASGLMTVSAIVNEAPPRPRSRVADIPPALEAIILRALEKDRYARYQRARELQKDLQDFIHGHAPAVSASDLGELVRRVQEGGQDAVDWLNHQQEAVAHGPVARPGTRRGHRDGASGTGKVSGYESTVAAARLDPPTLADAGKLGGVGVASGHMAGMSSPPSRPRFRYAESTRLKRRRLVAAGLVGSLLVAAGLALAWWMRPPLVAPAEGPPQPGVAAAATSSPPIVPLPVEPDAEDPEEDAGGGEPQEAAPRMPREVTVSVPVTPPFVPNIVPGDDPDLGPTAAAAAGGEGDAAAPSADAASPPGVEAGGGDAGSEGDGHPMAVGGEGRAEEGPRPDPTERPPPDEGDREPSPRRVAGAIRGVGTLAVLANLDGAEVWVDGRRHGTTPYREALFEGSYTVEVRAGEHVVTRSVKVGWGTQQDVRVTLPAGRLVVAGLPPNASCQLDGRNVAPAALAALKVVAGQHAVACDGPGEGETWRRTVTVSKRGRESLKYGE